MRADRRPPSRLQIAFLGMAAVSVFHWAYPLVDLAFVLPIAAVLAVIGWYGVQALGERLRARPRRDPRFAAPVELLDGDRYDLVGVRLAVERTVAIPMLATLAVAQRGVEAGKAARVARVLLAHQSAWRFAGLDATRPLPAARASEIFGRWSRDVRVRLSKATHAAGDAFRHDGLVLVSLHVASPGRMPAVNVDDPTAAAEVLTSLRDHSGSWATRVDLWSHERDFTAAELRRADPTLIELGDEETARAPVFVRRPHDGR